jgi:hypothetical protein
LTPGNHSATERPWLSHFAPRLQKTLNDLAADDGVEYEVEISKEDKEPLVVV